MNILIPHSWLLEYLATEAKPAQIAELLSLTGPSVERVYSETEDSVYDIEVTTNRADSLSIRGIAREVAVTLNQHNISCKFQDKTFASPTVDPHTLPLPKIINDPQLCHRITCVILSNIEDSPTPEWMSKRLTAIQANIHSSAIDITNYVTHELGHPCHAFDYDKIMQKGGEIHVVEANPNESFVTLDGSAFTTVGGEVVFKNGQGEIIDLPSIKGTLNTSVDQSTKNILLLLESIIPEKVRYSSMTHSIRTVAAQLMEKGIDPHLAEPVLFFASELYQSLCSATIACPVYDDFPVRVQPQVVNFPLSTLQTYLGISLESQAVTSILTQLGCTIEASDNQFVQVLPPTYRPDLKIPADIVEEVARVYGYHNLPSKLMDTQLPLHPPLQQSFTLETIVRSTLSLTGWQEIYTYSLVSEELANQSGFEMKNHLKLLNPLSDDRVFLRRSLLPSLREAVHKNPLREHLSVFEIAHAYEPQTDQLPIETLLLGMVSKLELRTFRGYLDALFQKLHIDTKNIEIVELSTTSDQKIPFKTTTETTQMATIIFQEKLIGALHIFSDGLIGAELYMAQLMELAHSHPSYVTLAKTTPIIEDLTFTFPPHTQIGQVIHQIEMAQPLVAKVQLKSIYNQNYTLTIWYHDDTENISNEKVEPIRKELAQLIENTWNATLVGTL